MRQGPPPSPYVSDEQLTEAILRNLWDGSKWPCPICDYSTDKRNDIIIHLQGHINDILAGRIPYSRPIPTPPKRE